MEAINFNLILLSVVLPILTAVSGLIQAQQSGEKIDWVIFFKTIFLGLVTGGFLSQQTSDLLTAVVGTQVILLALDKAFNALLNKVKRTQPE